MSFNHLVDRIAVLSSAIHEKASHGSHVKSRYASTMLHQPLAAYVREAEIVESRMFVVPQPGPGEIPTAVDLARKETASATPLKKARDAPLVLLEPEEYIRSVLKLCEKYNVMPRAQEYARGLLRQTTELQRRIPELEREYKEGMGKAGRGVPGSARKSRTLREEERLTREAEARAATLREQRDVLLQRLRANASVAESISPSDTSIFTSPSTIKGGPSIVAMSLSEGNESSAPGSNPPARPAPKRTAAQELQARRQARQAARRGQRSQPSILPSRAAATEEEKAFWSGDSKLSPSTLFASPPNPQGDSSVDTSISQLETETETDEGTPVSKPHEAQASDVDAETGDDDDSDGDVTVVLQPKQQMQSRRTFSLLRQSTTRMTMTPGKLASNNFETEIPAVPPLPRQPPPKSDPTIPPPESAPIYTAPTPDVTAKDADRVQMQDSSGSTSCYVFDASSPEVALQMTRVWKTVGETLVPDNVYSKNDNGPDTETTLNILSAIASLPVKSEDPGGEKTDATVLLLNSHRVPGAAMPIAPSALQVLTASLILTLLDHVTHVGPDATSTDDGNVWMPQNSLKATLKNNPWAVEAVSNTGVDWVMKTMLKVIPTKLIVLDRKRGAVRFGRE